MIVPHDELGDGEQQEELYAVVEGRARFTCNGEAVELEPGERLARLLRRRLCRQVRSWTLRTLSALYAARRLV